MYKEMVLQEVEALKKYLLRGTPAVPAPEEAASAAAAASAASAEALAAAELAASMAAEAARVASEALEVASAASAPASVAASTASEPVVVASAEEPVKKKTEKELKADKAAQAKKETKAEAKAEPSSDEAWVDQLPANAYVVQLAAMDTQEDMRSFQRSNAVYAKARILRARQKDSTKRYYILVAGPFESKSQADTFMQSSPLLAKGWLRSSKSMKTQFIKS
jgi:septal ring-binding cell division protein DamX